MLNGDDQETQTTGKGTTNIKKGACTEEDNTCGKERFYWTETAY